MRRQPLRRVRARQTGRAGPGAFSCVSHSPRESTVKEDKERGREWKESELTGEEKEETEKEKGTW